uniref:Uncharacterized protein n=1 Tax=Streptomyces sp. JL1001 TaxID=3078227 RepID=A0AAU8KFV7_9ACTN
MDRFSDEVVDLGRAPVPGGPDGVPVDEPGMVTEQLPEGVGIPAPIRACIEQLTP